MTTQKETSQVTVSVDKAVSEHSERMAAIVEHVNKDKAARLRLFMQHESFMQEKSLTQVGLSIGKICA